MSTVDSQIDSMIAAQSGNTSPASFNGTVSQPHASMRANSADGSVEVLGPNPSEQASTDPTRIHDAGLDLASAGAQLTANLKSLQDSLNAVQYDKTTGKPSHVLQGRAREVRQLELDTATKSAAYQLARFQEIAAQRSADEAAATTARLEEQRAVQFVQGDPARAAALKQALLQREAGEMAERLLAGRLNK